MSEISYKYSKCFVIICMMFIFSASFAQNHLDKALAFLASERTVQGVARDADDFLVLDNFITPHNRINHIYLQQTIGGIPVENAIINFNIDDNGIILDYHDRTSPNPLNRIMGNVNIDEETAIQLSLSNTNRSLAENGSKLIYKDCGNDGIIPTWRIIANDNVKKHRIRVDVCAITGRVLAEKDLILSFSEGELFNTPQYLVFPQSIENPNQGLRTLVGNPSFSLASPLGWHHDGNVGFTSTRGNNAMVKENISGDNSSFPLDAGNDLNFSYSLDFGESPTENTSVQNVDAAVTNAFYWTNLMHDVWYMYGFDEASGNFQENNLGKGGIGLDAVEVKVLDGSGIGSAYFVTTEEGRNPEMVLQLYEDGHGNQFNSAFDNGIIVHEYGHGITTRLTGGASTVTCLENEEQMGEGWSDYFALVMTRKPTDTRNTNRTMGSYLLGEDVDGLGFRPYPYNTDLGINPVTYADVSNTTDFTAPHGIGFIFASMLWDLYWELIQEYGYDEDIYQGNGGNNICHQLIMDALKLQPCSPGFVDARDAILLADEINNNGENRCLIWQSFARRGLGFSASQGSPFSRTDQVEAFDLPPDVSGVEIEKTSNLSSANEGDIITFTLDMRGQCVDAYGIELKDFLPENLEYIPGSASHDVTYSDGLLDWGIVPFLPKGEQITYTYKAAVKKGAFSSDGNVFQDEMGNHDNWSVNSSLGQNQWLLHPSGYWWASEPALEDYDFEHQYLTLNVSQQLVGYSELSFTHSYNTEQHWDGGTFEISTDGGMSWMDGGAYMVENAYDDYIANRAERPAFSGNSNGQINTRLDLSPFSCEEIMVRFNFYYDKYQAGEGWRIYDIFLKTEAGIFSIAQAETVDGIISQSSACATITDPSNLPIEWGEVTATAREDKFIRLDWNTLTEEDNRGFEIERYSESSGIFQPIAFVDGQGNSVVEVEYEFDDYNVQSGVLYHYRIRQIDMNGDYNYSNIVSSRLEATRLTAKIFPNPVVDNILNLSITNPSSDEDLEVEIFSSEGKLIQKSRYQLAQNHQVFSLDLSSYSKGMYLIRLSNFSFVQVEQLIIR